jgi:hypothetical protein
MSWLTLIPATLEVVLQFEASLGKKFVRSHLNQKPGVVVYTCHPIYAGGIRRRMVIHPRQKHETLPEKITKAEKD